MSWLHHSSLALRTFHTHITLSTIWLQNYKKLRHVFSNCTRILINLESSLACIDICICFPMVVAAPNPVHRNNSLDLARKICTDSFPRKIVYSKMRTVNFVSFEEQITSKDKCTSIFLRKIQSFVLIILKKILQRAWKMFTNSLLYEVWDVFFWVLSGVNFITKISSSVITTKRSLNLIQIFNDDVRFENWGMSLGWNDRKSPCFSWGIFRHVLRLDQSRASKIIWQIINT